MWREAVCAAPALFAGVGTTSAAFRRVTSASRRSSERSKISAGSPRRESHAAAGPARVGACRASAAVAVKRISIAVGRPREDERRDGVGALAPELRADSGATVEWPTSPPPGAGGATALSAAERGSLADRRRQTGRGKRSAMSCSTSRFLRWDGGREQIPRWFSSVRRGAQQSDRRQVERALREAFQDHRKAAGGARGLDPVVGLVLREVQDLVAVREQGRKAFPQVQVPGVELDEMRDEARGRTAFGLRELADRRDQLGIGQVGRNQQYSWAGTMGGLAAAIWTVETNSFQERVRFQRDGAEPSRIVTTRRPSTSFSRSTCPLGHGPRSRPRATRRPSPKCSRRSSCEP